MDSTSGKVRLEEKRPRLGTAALTVTGRELRQPPTNGSSTPLDLTFETEKYGESSLDPSCETTEEHHALVLSRTVDGPGKRALRETTNAVRRQQQGGFISKPAVISHSPKKQLGTTSGMIRGEPSNFKRRRYSQSLYPKLRSQNAKPSRISSSSESLNTKEDNRNSPTSELSSCPRSPVHLYPDNISFAGRTKNLTPYLSHSGIVSGFVEIDRTISKDNTGGEAARLACLLAKLSTPRKPNTQRHLVTSMKPRREKINHNPNKPMMMRSGELQQGMPEQIIDSSSTVAQAQQMVNGINPVPITEQPSTNLFIPLLSPRVKAVAPDSANSHQRRAPRVPNKHMLHTTSGTGVGGVSTRAPKDINMRKMLLEDQKRRRLIMARQEMQRVFTKDNQAKVEPFAIQGDTNGISVSQSISQLLERIRSDSEWQVKQNN